MAAIQYFVMVILLAKQHAIWSLILARLCFQQWAGVMDHLRMEENHPTTLSIDNNYHCACVIRIMQTAANHSINS